MRRGADVGAVLALAGFALLLYAPLLFTNRVLATGDIAANAFHRHVLVSEDNAGQRLDLDILH